MHLYIANKVYSSWSFRPWIVMRAKGIAFDETVIPLRMADTTQRIMQASPTGKVPCLVDGDVNVWESLAILDYLADIFPDKAIWPADRRARAHARAIAAEMHAGFQPLRQAHPMTITQRFEPRPLAADVAANVQRITAIWNQARAHFADHSQGPFLYGAFSAADGMYAPVVARFHSYGVTVDAPSQAYMDAMRSLPAYQAWVADAAKEAWVIAQNTEDIVIEDLRKPR